MTMTRSKEPQERPREAPAATRVGKPSEEKSPAGEGNGPAGGRPPREELTPQQLWGIAALLTQPTIAAAAKEIEVHPRTISRWFREPAFMAEYVTQIRELQLELWSQMLRVRSEVWGRFLELMRSPDERVALRATTWFLEKLLSTPAILERVAVGDDEAEPDIPPRVRALLQRVDAIERGDGGTGG